MPNTGTKCGKELLDSEASCDCVAPPQQTPTLSGTKSCPFCAEEILCAAKKCKHCGEFLDGSNPRTAHGEAVGAVLLLVPHAAVFLIWIWVGQMNLLQSPGSILTALACLTVILTAGLAASEAGRIKTKPSPVTWFVAFLFLWVVAYPAYLFNRRKHGRKNLLLGGLVVTVAFACSVVMMSASIESQEQKIRDAFDRVGSAVDALTGSGKPDSRTLPDTSLEAGPQLELVGYSWRIEYGYAILEGQVTNISSDALRNVTALASFYDADNGFITSADSLIDYNPILPGQTSPFKVSATSNPTMKKARVVFKELAGGTIPFRTAESKRPPAAEPLVTFEYPKQTVSTKAKSVRDVNFSAFSYPRIDDVSNSIQPPRLFQLISGKIPKSSAEQNNVDLNRVQYGDLTGDGIEEAAVILEISGGGTGIWYYVIYTPCRTVSSPFWLVFRLEIGRTAACERSG